METKAVLASAVSATSYFMLVVSTDMAEGWYLDTCYLELVYCNRLQVLKALCGEDLHISSKG